MLYVAVSFLLLQLLPKGSIPCNKIAKERKIFATSKGTFG